MACKQTGDGLSLQKGRTEEKLSVEIDMPSDSQSQHDRFHSSLPDPILRSIAAAVFKTVRGRLKTRNRHSKSSRRLRLAHDRFTQPEQCNACDPHCPTDRTFCGIKRVYRLGTTLSGRIKESSMGTVHHGSTVDTQSLVGGAHLTELSRSR